MRDDPNLTRYTLGEMDDDERAAFEAELSDEARREVEAIRRTAAAVGAALAAEAAPAPSAVLRRKVRGRRPWLAIAVAASFLLVAGASIMFLVPQGRYAAAKREAYAFREAKEWYAHGARAATYFGDTVGVGVIEMEQPLHTEAYDRIVENAFRRVADQDVSTFSIDVDTASYANVRRFLMGMNQLPPKDAVRIEEMINYFRYDYPGPDAWSEHPFKAHVAVAACPWNPKHRLARVAIKGRTVETKQRPPTNLVFLIDVSGSMRPSNKLPLLKRALRLLVEQLDEGDRVAMVVYAGAAGLVLPSTSGAERAAILGALDRLESGGSTNGGAGIELAYRVARESFLEGGVNRVILATDGDFNVGTTDRGSLTRLIEEKAKTGVFLSILGFGTGNYKDAAMEDLSNRGNGNYAYVDTLKEAKKVLVEEMTGTLVTIAKDVKIQVFFNPATVEGWRLVGYENRLLRKEDFNDDAKDAGEIGAGHAVTALYELVPKGGELPGPRVDPNPFVEERDPSGRAGEGAIFRLRLRYKRPDGERSTLLEEDVFDEGRAFDDADADFRWAAAVASFGMLLRDSPFRGDVRWESVLEIATGSRGADPGGYRAEFLDLVRKAQALTRR